MIQTVILGNAIFHLNGEVHEFNLTDPNHLVVTKPTYVKPKKVPTKKVFTNKVNVTKTLSMRQQVTNLFTKVGESHTMVAKNSKTVRGGFYSNGWTCSMEELSTSPDGTRYNVTRVS